MASLTHFNVKFIIEITITLIPFEQKHNMARGISKRTLATLVIMVIIVAILHGYTNSVCLCTCKGNFLNTSHGKIVALLPYCGCLWFASNCCGLLISSTCSSIQFAYGIISE